MIPIYHSYRDIPRSYSIFPRLEQDSPPILWMWLVVVIQASDTTIYLKRAPVLWFSSVPQSLKDMGRSVKVQDGRGNCMVNKSHTRIKVWSSRWTRTNETFWSNKSKPINSWMLHASIGACMAASKALVKALRMRRCPVRHVSSGSFLSPWVQELLVDNNVMTKLYH